MAGEAEGLLLGFTTATPPGGEVNPSLEGLGPLMTDATTLPGGDTNTELAGLAFLNATGEGFASFAELKQLPGPNLLSNLAVGVGLWAVASRLSAQSHVAASMGVLA